MAPLVTARVRYQPGQALLVVLLAALVSLSGVLGAAFSHAVEEFVQTQTLAGAPVSARGVSVERSAADPGSPAALLHALGPGLTAAVWGTPVAGAHTDGLIVHGAVRALVPVVARAGLCQHLTLARGRCLEQSGGPASTGTGAPAVTTASAAGGPPANGQVLVSTAEAERLGVDVGSTLTVADAGQSNDRAVLRLSIVGVYAPYDDADEYWFDRPTGQTPVAGTSVQGGDTLFVDWTVLRSATWRTVTTSVDVPGRADQMRIGRTAQVRGALTHLTSVAGAAGASTTTQLPALLDRAATRRSDARSALPLLALQIVLLALVVLGYVAAATTEQRRAEVALARLRGQPSRSAAAFLMRELGLLIAVGTAIGAVAGWACALVAGRWWLSGPTPVQVPVTFTLLLVATGAFVAGLVCAVVVTVPTVREPLVTLLRSVPPRSSALRAGVGDGVVVALCAAGLVTLLTGEPEAPTALLAPGLLALAGGLLLAQVVVPVAASVGRRQLRRGRLRSALAAVAVARRPALRRLVAIITVAVALLVFASGAGAVAGDQRRVEASQRVGAAVVLTVAADGPSTLRRAVGSADPTGRYATPVLVGLGATDHGPRSMAVDPTSFPRVALWGRSDVAGRGAPALRDLTPASVTPVRFTGSTAIVTVDLKATPIEPDNDERFMLGPGWHPTTQGLAFPLTVQLDLDLTDLTDLTNPAGSSPSTDPKPAPSTGDPSQTYQEVTLGQQVSTGRSTLAVAVPCTRGCSVRRIRLLRDQGDFGGVKIDAAMTLEVASTTKGTPTPVPLRGGDTGWAPAASFPTVTVGGTASTLVLRSRNFGGDLVAQRDDIPAALPALVSGDVPMAPNYGMTDRDPTELVGATSATGDQQVYDKVGTLPRVPGVVGPVVLTSYDLAAHLEGPLGGQARQQVWLATDDTARERALVKDLADSGVQVVHRDSLAATERVLGGEGPALTLRLALMVGVLALVLAACVLGVAVATSGRVRAHDFAGLRVVGVPRAVVAGAAVREQLVVAVVGVLGGALLGGIGAALTLSRSADSALPPPAVSAGWAAAAAAVVVCLTVLGLVCVVLGRRLVSRAVPELLSEGAR